MRNRRSIPTPTRSAGQRPRGRTRLETLFLLSVVVMLVAVSMIIVKEMSQPTSAVYSPPPALPTRAALEDPSTRPATSPSTEPATRDSGAPGELRIAEAKTQIANLRTALEMFEIDNGRYPTNEEGLAILIQAPEELRTWRGPYLKELPRDPWGRQFRYRFPGTHDPDRFDVFSLGPGGRESGDVIGNWTK